MSHGGSYHQGHYTPENPEKYKGKSNPIFRSSWEKIFFQWADRNPRVLEWYSELPIPYYSQVKGRMSRYYVDVWIKYKNNKDEIVTEIIEIKPDAETKPPKKSNTPKGEKRFITESLTYMNNQEKWNAAVKYAEERGWNFRILTENHLFKG